MQQYFETWQTQGVFGHFKSLTESPLPTWLDADIRASERIAPIVGALPSEVAVMETLTANLHLLMSAFYKPDIKKRHKIIIENQAFPSDHVSLHSSPVLDEMSCLTRCLLCKGPRFNSSEILSLVYYFSRALPGSHFISLSVTG